MAPDNSSDSDNTSVEAIARNTDDNTLVVALDDVDVTKAFKGTYNDEAYEAPAGEYDFSVLTW